MTTRAFLSAVTTITILGMVAQAAEDVIITADVEAYTIEQVFDVGDIVPVTFYIASEGGPPVFGVDFAAVLTTGDARIHAVTFDPAFSRWLGRPEPELPGHEYRAVRMQPMRDLDESLGADGGAVPFATVELEVLNGKAFESALEVQVRCALVGAMPESTTVLGVESSGRELRPGRLTIVNTRPAPEWTEQEAGLTISVRPIGGGDPVTVLAPDTEYELHYESDGDRLNGYLLAVAAPAGDPGLSSAEAPASGDWSAAENFYFMDLAAESTPASESGAADESEAADDSGAADESGSLEPWDDEGNYLTHLVGDFWQDPDHEAAGAGHLCNFTTGAPGELTLDLFMDWLDPAAHHSVWVRAAATFIVENSADQDSEAGPDGG